MIDKSKTYRTRCGREVRIYATDGAKGKIHGAMLTDEGWEHRTWDATGRIMLCEPHDYDLIEVRPRHKRVVWVNVYETSISIWDSKEHADARADRASFGRIACLRVELDFAEGDGL